MQQFLDRKKYPRGAWVGIALVGIALVLAFALAASAPRGTQHQPAILVGSLARPHSVVGFAGQLDLATSRFYSVAPRPRAPRVSALRSVPAFSGSPSARRRVACLLRRAPGAPTLNCLAIIRDRHLASSRSSASSSTRPARDRPNGPQITLIVRSDRVFTLATRGHVRARFHRADSTTLHGAPGHVIIVINVRLELTDRPSL